MYLSNRIMHSAPEHMGRAVELVVSLVDKLNDEHGGALQATVSVGIDPYALAICGQWTDLDKYEALQRGEGISGDARALIQLAAGMFDAARTEEQIYRIMVPGDTDPQPITIVNTADIVLDRYAEAIGYCVDITTAASQLSMAKVGFGTALVGGRGRVMWWHTAPSIAEAANMIEKLETETMFIDKMHAGNELFQPGSVNRRLWRRLN